MTALSGILHALAPRRLRNAALALTGALLLSACSTVQGDLAGLFQKTPPAPPPIPAEPAPTPQIDFATSTTIHPDIWPKGTSGVADDAAIDAQAADLLSKMTLEEKVGQLFQVNINSLTPDDVRKYHLGSVLNGGDDGPNKDLRALPQAWLDLADKLYAASIDVPAGHAVVPLIWGIDAVHGNDHIIGATVFPHNIALGAMDDPALVEKIGEATAEEIRVTGQDWTFAPTIAVVRNDRWGRTYEGYSEDPRIVSDYAAAMITGLQGVPGTPDFLIGPHLLATAKHYIGDGGTNHGHDQGDTLYSEEAMRDLFAPPYEAAIKAGAQTVMASYSSWRGLKMHADKALLTDVLRDRLGFNGLVISDYHGYAQVPGCSLEDCPAAINAGIDMFMGADNWKALYANTLAEVKSGIISMARLDEAVLRILRVKLRAGVMSEGKPSSRPYAGQWNVLGSPEHRAIARQAVRESLVLLKNEDRILPLSPHAHVLVAGEGADNLPQQCGGWTISWQGGGNTRADFPHGETIYEGIKANVEAAGGNATLSIDGSFKDKPDVAIVVFGEQPYAEGRGDRPDLDFAADDSFNLALIRNLRAQGIPVVTVFLSGRPLYVTPEIDASNAFVAAWLPGTEGAGIADVLFAKPDGGVAYDFHGKLSYSWPRSPDQTELNVGTEPYYPLFAYGYGLSYAEPKNIGQLPLAPEASAGRLDFLADGKTASSWAVSLMSMNGTAAQNPAPVDTAALRLAARKGTPAGLDATWTGKGEASLVLSGAPVDLAGQTIDGMALALTLRVTSPPAKEVMLGMACGTGCQGRLDITRALQSAYRKGQTTLAVPLMCLRQVGVNMASVTAPLELSSGGKLALSLDDVTIAAARSPLRCP